MLVPVFAGRDLDNNELFILYKEKAEAVPNLVEEPNQVKRPEDFFLMLPGDDNVVHALPAKSQLAWWPDENMNFAHMKIISSVWTGELRGSSMDMVEADTLDTGDDHRS